MHTSEPQSVRALHFLPAVHFGAAVSTPPQSTSDSSAFWTPSVLDGTGSSVVPASSGSPVMGSTGSPVMGSTG